MASPKIRGVRKVANEDAFDAAAEGHLEKLTEGETNGKFGTLYIGPP